MTVVDGRYHRHAGSGIVMAGGPEEARTVVVDYLRNDTAYGKPYQVSDVQPHDPPEPQVLFFNHGEWDEWPPAHDTPEPAGPR